MAPRKPSTATWTSKMGANGNQVSDLFRGGRDDGTHILNLRYGEFEGWRASRPSRPSVASEHIFPFQGESAEEYWTRCKYSMLYIIPLFHSIAAIEKSDRATTVSTGYFDWPMVDGALTLHEGGKDIKTVKYPAFAGYTKMANFSTSSLKRYRNVRKVASDPVCTVEALHALFWTKPEDRDELAQQIAEWSWNNIQHTFQHFDKPSIYVDDSDPLCKPETQDELYNWILTSDPLVVWLQFQTHCADAVAKIIFES